MLACSPYSNKDEMQSNRYMCGDGGIYTNRG